MKIDLYQLSNGFHFTDVVYPIVLDVLKVWAESAGWKARVATCREHAVNYATNAHVVGISVYTQTAPSAYRVADRLRSRGKIVLLGGPHFRGSATFREAASHCDAVVSSVCESQWHRLLGQIRGGMIRCNAASAKFLVDDKAQFRYPNDFYEPHSSRKWYQVPSVPTSLGCPYSCNFCSPYLKGRYFLRKIDTIANEVARIRNKVIFLADATFGLHRKFTIQLMRALAPLGKLITIETALIRLQDARVLDALAEGGVKWIIVGVETLSMKLEKHGTSDLTRTIRHIVREVHRRKMYIQGNFICGLDCDGPESFGGIYRLCREIPFDSIMVDALTPYPNTGLYEQLQRNGRIIDTDWAHYDYKHIVYRPLHMTVDQLIDGLIGLYERLLNVGAFLRQAKRLYTQDGVGRATSVVVANNAYFVLDAKRKIRALQKNRLTAGQFSAPAHARTHRCI